MNHQYFFEYFGIFRLISDDSHVKICTFTALSPGSFCQIYRVTDEALIAEAAVWPNVFLVNVFFALKGYTNLLLLFIFISFTITLQKKIYTDLQKKPVIYINGNFDISFGALEY